MSADPIRVGVVGAGGMGACHARNIVDLSVADLAWVADPAEQAGRTLADELGTLWIANGIDALADCDAVVIACPEQAHAQFAQAAIELRLPTLCEKPLTSVLAEAAEIVHSEVAAGRRLIQVGFMREYDERHLQVAESLAPLGEVNHIRCVHRNTNDQARPVATIMVESIIHDIHTVRWLSRSEILEVSTAVVRRDRGPRFVSLTCLLSNGAVAGIEFDDCAAGYEVSVEVSAEDGNVTAADPHRAQVRTDGAVMAQVGSDWFTPFLDAYRVEMRVWLNSILAGEATGPSAWDGYAAQAVVEAAMASKSSGVAEPVVLIQQPEIYQPRQS